MSLLSQSGNQGWAVFKEQVEMTLMKALQPKIVWPVLTEPALATGPVMALNSTNDSWIDPSRVSQSGEYSSAVLDFARDYVSMKEIGVAPRIPINYIKDSMYDLIFEHIEEIGFGIARYMNSDLLTAMNIWVAGGTYEGKVFSAVSGNTLTPAAAWNTSSADIVDDIAQVIERFGINYCEDGKIFMIVHPSQFRYIATDPNFFKYYNIGNNDLATKRIYPSPYGVDILTTQQASSTYILFVNKEYARIKFYEREPLNVEMERSIRTKFIDLAISMRYAFYCRRPKAIVKLNGVL